MKVAGLLIIVSCLTVALFNGCSSKKSATAELEKAAAIVAQPEPAQAAPAPEPPQQTPSAQQPAQPAAPAKAQAQEMNQAMASYKAGDLDDAVARLQKLRATPAMSAEKRMALNDAMAAVMGEIYGRAAKGDAKALQAVKLYEEFQTRPR